LIKKFRERERERAVVQRVTGMVLMAKNGDFY
jgi:hypothetical protein